MKMNREETEEQLHRVTVLLCNAIIAFNNVNVLPSTHSLEEMFYVAIALFGFELVCHLLHIYTFISVWGAGLNLILLTALMLKEKHDDNVIMRSYAKVRKRINKSKRRNMRESAKLKHRGRGRQL